MKTIYIIGGYLGKYTFSQKKRLSIIYFIFWILLYFLSSFFTFKIFLFQKKKKSKITFSLFVNYLSPTIILESFSLIFFFSRLNIENKLIIKIISFFTPLTFNITLIHSFIFREHYLRNNLFKYINELKPDFFYFKFYGISIITYICCSFIDYFRFLLFRELKIKDLCILIEEQYS